EEGVNGFIVPAHDPGAIAAALKRLIEDKDLREKMGKASRIIAERDYDVEKVAEKHLQIYEALDSVSGK
ncbi:MAG: glycosyltransferase family 1 protein, partial [Muribaculaceae bacterium]|nr:glycosyltransferase family 1 protein [Muribaculaceae bacterium]